MTLKLEFDRLYNEHYFNMKTFVDTDVVNDVHICIIEDIYFFEVNIKYISSNVLKMSVISRVRSTSVIADMLNI